MSGTAQPRCPLARVQGKPIDTDNEKRAGWQRHRILVVGAVDERLTWPERELVRQLGARLYGKQREASDDR